MALKHLPRLLVLLAAALLVGLLWWAAPHVVRPIENRLADYSWRLFADATLEPRLVLIDIDEKSLAELGPWPWPRARLAELAQRLDEAGAARQVWDIVFDAPQPDDAVFAQALARSRAVLAAAFAFPGQGEAIDAGRLGTAGPTLPCRSPFPEAHGQRAPAAAYAALPVGHIAYRVDADGVVRALPAFVCRNGQAWPALALAAWLDLAGAASPRLDKDSAALRLSAPGLPAAVPLTAAGELLVSWRKHPDAFVALSAADLLAGRAPRTLIEGRIALIGSSAHGLADVVATPFGGAQAGPLVHAETLAALLDDAVPIAVSPLPTLLMAGLGASLLLGLLAWRTRLIWLVPLSGGALALLLLLGQLVLLGSRGLLVPLAPAALYALLAALLLAAEAAFRLARERGRLFAHLAAFLPAPFAARLASRAPEAGVSAERVEASVLVADLRNFSAWSAQQPPEAVAGLLDKFLAAAVDAVEATGGEIEALEGDAVIALWNGRSPCPHHAERALAAARALAERSARLLPPGDTEALPPPLALGLGVESGLLLVGALGPRQRRQHIALGQPLARAVRLAELTAELGYPILVGPELAERLPLALRGTLIRQGEFLLEGQPAPCSIHALAA